MKKIGVNSVVGAIFILFALYWKTLINKLPQGTRLAIYGPGFFPNIVVWGLIVVSSLLIIQDLLRKNQGIKFEIKKSDMIKVLSLVAILIAYLFAMPIITYVPATIIALAITLYLFDLKSKKMLLIVSIAFPVIANFVFQSLLKVGLP